MVLINIDTAKDSPEEIRKTIRYLESLVDEEESASPPTPAPQPASPAEFGGMEIFKDETPPDKAAESAPKKSDAERLLKEADEEAAIEVEDNKDAFIEIVDLDDDQA